jgi:hypothetical protein
MSLHNHSYLVSSHQAELASHAAEHRRAVTERRIADTPSRSETHTSGASPVRRILVQMAHALRPVRRSGVSPRI